MQVVLCMRSSITSMTALRIFLQPNIRGLTLSRMQEGTIGPSVEQFYARAGRHDLYLRDLGLPVVASFCFRRL